MKNCILILSVLALFSCGSRVNNSHNDLVSSIDSLNKNILSGDKSLNVVVANDLISKFDTFVKLFPEDTLSPIYLFRMAEIYLSLERGKDAILNFEKFEKNYPSHQKFPYSIFMQAYTYDNIMKNIPKAKETYEKFIKMFPKHDLTDDAEACISYLGKSDEDLIKLFEDQNKLQTQK